MNTYVIIARHLGTVSGEKIYTYNKLEYMVSRGWRVLFLSGKDEQDQIDESAGYSFHLFPALVYGPECYSRREVAQTLEAVASLIGDLKGDRCVIESDSVNRALWGELVARRVGAKHLVFLLQEHHRYDEETKRFLRFKYDRHELAGISKDSIHQILGDDSVEQRDDTRISAFCNNSIRECRDVFSDQLRKDATLTFGSLGRLDKGCVPAILQGFETYAAHHPDEQFNLVLIGGATGPKRIRKIREEMKAFPNIHLVITGYIYPIPVSLVNRVDVFVSTAGSAGATYRYHRPTVKVRPNDGKPVAVLGLDSMRGKTMYDALEGVTIEACIARALRNRDRIIYYYNYYEDYQESMYQEFARQLDFADRVPEKAYYDETLLTRIRITYIKGHTVHRVIGHLFGANGLNRFIVLMKKIKGV